MAKKQSNVSWKSRIRSGWGFAALALIVAVVITFGVVGAPSYTDAYYHFNAAQRWVTLQGMTDPYVWTYIGATDSLPMPSHLYWMPMTSTLAGIGMDITGSLGDYRTAQIPFALLLWGTGMVGYWLGRRLGSTPRHAWSAGLLTLISPFFIRFWGATDTFAPYAFFGSACLVLIGLAVMKPRLLTWAGVGALTALAHLTRADGLLLLIVAVFFALIAKGTLKQRGTTVLVVVAAYVIVMLPYFIGNLNAIGSPLPLGGTQAIWFDEYDDIFNYPPDASPATLFADGVGAFIQSRVEALTSNLGTLIAVEGVVVLLPFMLIGGWVSRHNRFLHPFWLYAVGMHVAMTFVFPFPGYRGGLFHSAAALIPFWSILALLGIDASVDWIAKRRRQWQPALAKTVFTAAALLLAGGLALLYGINGRVLPVTEPPALYAELYKVLPYGSRVLYDDPPELYYYTGIGGATLPNESPEVILDIARQYDVQFLVLKNDLAAIPAELLPILDAPPDFLELIPFEQARLYAIRSE